MKRGFSVLELVVSTFCLALISAGMFVIFHMCSDNFRLGMTRQGLQNQITSFSARFGIDVRQSSIYSVWVNPRSATVELEPGMSGTSISVRRDSICLAALKDPNSPLSYETGTGLPKWDCYWIYTATPEGPTGRLVRFRSDVSANVAQIPLADFKNVPSNYNVIPSPKAVVGTSQTLGHGLYKFEAEMDYANQQLVVRIAFRGERGHTKEGRSLSEVAETLFRVKPENSWPRM